MENLIFSLEATMPIFFTMVMGYVFRHMGLMETSFVNKLNKFVFNAALPALLFCDLSEAEFTKVWNGKFVLFCAVATCICIVISMGVSCLWKDKAIQGEFVQGAYRSSAAILGIAFIQNIYGDSGMAPLMIIASVPIYNIMAVVVLSFLKPDRGSMDLALVKKTLKGIITNPIILGIVIGVIWSAFKLPRPNVLMKTANNLGVLATPLGLMAMGAAFDEKKAFARLKPALTASAMKLVGWCAIFLPMAIALGFRDQELTAILVMLGSATTVSCYIMARNMGHDGVLSSSIVMITTFCSAFTLTGWLCLFRTLGML
ncbi:MAG: AEC family transporter [Clostridia bacterium]|nr:AEC family transporter [Clostridia bacterium]NCC43366.1 AEC family transporter [Clostridia bacterium]